MKIAIVTMFALTVVCAMPLIAHADDEADLQMAGQAIGELVTAEAMYSAALDGECGKHAPEYFRIARETMRLNIADLKEMLPPSSKQKITEQLNREDFKSQLNTFRTKAVDETLAMFRGKGVGQAFACGYVFGYLTELLLRSEQHRLRALKQLGK
jgi:hypothetical protein